MIATQVYRSGQIEAVVSSILRGPTDGPGHLTTVGIEGAVLITAVRYLKSLAEIGAGPPYALMVSLVGVKGTQINVGLKENWFDEDYDEVLLQNDYHYAEVILDTVPTSVQECGEMIRPFIEQLANTAGRATSMSFDTYGRYLPVF